jgi:hypothetical protein
LGKTSPGELVQQGFQWILESLHAFLGLHSILYSQRINSVRAIASFSNLRNEGKALRMCMCTPKFVKTQIGVCIPPFLLPFDNFQDAVMPPQSCRAERPHLPKRHELLICSVSVYSNIDQCVERRDLQYNPAYDNTEAYHVQRRLPPVMTEDVYS